MNTENLRPNGLISAARAKHLLEGATPGRWHVDPPNYRDQVTRISAPHGDGRLHYDRWEGLAEVYGQEDNPERGTEAMVGNANLIASAPDLARTVLVLSAEIARALRDIAADCDTAGDYDVLHAAADIIGGGKP